MVADRCQARGKLLSRWRTVLQRIGYACALLGSLYAPAWGQSSGSSSSGGFLSNLGIESPLKSSDPAIKAAAKAKAAKHKIHKKKGALKYLAGLGCVPERPEVAAALVAAMGDPDEPVRYEAVKAVLQTAGNCMSDDQKKAMNKALGFHEACALAKDKCHKAVCNCIDVMFGKAPPPQHKHELLAKLHSMIPGRKEECEDPSTQEPEECSKRHGNCCTPEIKAKLMELAYGRDKNGCFLERSERIRTAARQAVEACEACANGDCQDCDPCEGSQSNVREMAPRETREMLGGQSGSGGGSALGSGVTTLPPCGCQPQASSVLANPPSDVPFNGELVPLPIEEPRRGQPQPQPVEELPPLQLNSGANAPSPRGIRQAPYAPTPGVMSLPSVLTTAPRSVLTTSPSAHGSSMVMPLPPAP